MIKKFMIIMTIMFLTGCSTKTHTEYQPVYIPMKCNINIPEAPEYDEDVIITNINILNYAEKLKVALDICVNGEE